MRAVENNDKKTIEFTASASSFSRIEQLMTRTGESRMSRLIARGLALVQFVEDQADLGRTVGSLETGEEDFEALEERAELLAPINPPPILTAVPTPAPASAAEPAAEPQAVPAAAPVAALVAAPAPKLPKALTETDNPKLKARPKNVMPEPKPVRKPPKRKLPKFRAYSPNDVYGPVKSLKWEQETAANYNRAAPIDNCGSPLPGLLHADHLEQLEHSVEAMKNATHFYVEEIGVLVFAGFFGSSGWLYYHDVELRWKKAEGMNMGRRSVYSVDQAIEYLKRNPGYRAHEPVNPVEDEETTF